MLIIFEICGGPHDGGYVDFDIPPERLSDLESANCDGEDYSIEDVDLVAGTGRLIHMKNPPFIGG